MGVTTAAMLNDGKLLVYKKKLPFHHTGKKGAYIIE
jgi:hypothetical protein